MGSYGAVLANGAEFTGDFGSLTWDALVEFHRIRIEAVAATKPDLLAFETVPCVFESSAIVKALEQCSSKGITLQPAWISFSCRDSHSSNAGDSAEACATSIKDSPFVFGVGVNCTKPEFVKGILESYKKTLEGSGKVLICYPNKGETWDAVGRGWVDQTGVQNVEAYADMAKSWIEAGATIVGGCCRIGPNHLACLKESL
ncbi:Homocysteine S-methyltransferase [Rhizoclosmatium globosum]|uniref:Homocysteine S-methyltransferase n=1 Tax=Rhizoclosmatium globosum TaxID=329046 RepID=A0A1Y2D394_9FUNG|nr:Homocysteine S-methyltransferase [Rhizoclosmatium globosum]|eukprot:ORY53763.1 Homocysteine S-methyltransferase [Rhizoclosmatium globosum]